MTHMQWILAAAGIGGLFGLGCGHEHRHYDEQPQSVVLYDDNGFEHTGYYDQAHDWHGGYYDQGHAFHNDAHDWRGNRDRAQVRQARDQEYQQGREQNRGQEQNREQDAGGHHEGDREQR